MVIIVIVGVIIILAGGFLTKPGDATNVNNNNSTGSNPVTGSNNGYTSGEEVVADIESRLSELLSQVEGAGKVSVMIYTDSSSEMIPAYNDTQDNRSQEQDDGKSIESSTRKELALSGGEDPVILKVVIPEVKGVVVVAEGAGDFLVKQELSSAVCTLLGVPEHRVQILKHK